MDRFADLQPLEIYKINTLPSDCPVTQYPSLAAEVSQVSCWCVGLSIHSHLVPAIHLSFA